MFPPFAPIKYNRINIVSQRIHNLLVAYTQIKCLLLNAIYLWNLNRNFNWMHSTKKLSHNQYSKQLQFTNKKKMKEKRWLKSENTAKGTIMKDFIGFSSFLVQIFGKLIRFYSQQETLEHNIHARGLFHILKIECSWCNRQQHFSIEKLPLTLNDEVCCTQTMSYFTTFRNEKKKTKNTEYRKQKQFETGLFSRNKVSNVIEISTNTIDRFCSTGPDNLLFTTFPISTKKNGLFCSLHVWPQPNPSSMQQTNHKIMQ